MIALSSHAALITGSTKGVGLAIAKAFAAAGAEVVLHGRTQSRDSEQAIVACRQHGSIVDFVTADLAEPNAASVPDLFDRAIKANPKIDILVNNAGQYFDLPFEQMTVDRLSKTISLNVTSGYFLTQAFARRWTADGTSGRVLFIGSINGRLAEPDSTAYDTSKGAVEMMVKTLCVALAPKGIRVNGLAPGLVRTPQTHWLDDQPETVDWIKQHTPNHQIPDASVCGEGAVYLVSNAAEHVHGQMLLVDGGLSVWQHPLADISTESPHVSDEDGDQS